MTSKSSIKLVGGGGEVKIDVCLCVTLRDVPRPDAS